jgi:flagellar biosynthetic protein FlhB
MAAHDQDKVFAPTPRKRRQAREQGQVVISPDLVSGMMLLTFTAILHLFGHRLIDASGTYLKGSLEQVRMESFGGREQLSSHLVGQFGGAAGYFLVRLWPFWMLPLVVIVTVLVQTRGLIHWPAVTPSLNRINPATGLQRFSFPHIGGRLLGTSLKAAGLASIAWFWVIKQHELDAQLDLAHQTQAELEQAVSFLFVLSLGLLAWGVLDYLVRRRRFERQLRMTARELADEQKQFEPDPALDRRSQEIRSQFTNALSLNRKTDLLITDGLASCTLLRFDPQSQSVPLVVGRETGPAGVQLLQRCLQSKVPVHEAAELQQELSRTTGGILPERLWPPIAELLSRQTENKTETKTAGEPEIPERVSS